MPISELKPESFHKYKALLKMTGIFLFNIFFPGLPDFAPGITASSEEKTTFISQSGSDWEMEIGC